MNDSVHIIKGVQYFFLEKMFEGSGIEAEPDFKHEKPEIHRAQKRRLPSFYPK
jgi:hypothetical protein